MLIFFFRQFAEFLFQLYIYIYINRAIGLTSGVFTNGPGDQVGWFGFFVY